MDTMAENAAVAENAAEAVDAALRKSDDQTRDASSSLPFSQLFDSH